MRYIHTACAAIRMTGCAATANTSTAPEANPGQQWQSLPMTSAVEMQALQPVAETLAKLTPSDAINVVEVRHKETNSLIDELDSASTGHQVLEPFQCLTWVDEQKKSNPWLKTCDASPTIN